MEATAKKTYNYLSLGVQCAAYGCNERKYIINNDGERVLNKGISFYSFPKDSSPVKKWCNLIKRRNGQDEFKVTASTRVCSKHFTPCFINKPPQSSRTLLKEGATPILHSWNNFDKTKATSSSSTFTPRTPAIRSRLSPRKKPANKEVTQFVSDILSDLIDNALLQIEEKHIDQLNNVLETYLEADKLKIENEALKYEINSLQNEKEEKSKSLEFVDSVLESEENVKHYSGMPTIDILNSLFIFLDAGPYGKNIKLYNYQTGKNDSRGRKRKLTSMQSFLLVLVHLRRNYDIKHLCYLFKISETNVSNTFITWVNFMYLKFGSINIWPTLEQVSHSMPASMKEKYPHVKCIIECVEFKVEVPSSLYLHKIMYSEYKSHTTVKALVGIAPGGGFTFVSGIFPGSTSDKQITVRSGLLRSELWKNGDGLMANRGFTIAEYLNPLGVDLVIPSFLKGREQFSCEEVVSSLQIAHSCGANDSKIEMFSCVRQSNSYYHDGEH